MNRKHKRLIRRISYMLPRVPWFYGACKMYVDNVQGQNNADMLINGELELLKQLIRDDGSVVFDVGANTGQWTKSVLSLAPSSRIHCFEPSRSTFERLVRNAFPPNVTLNQSGLGESSQQVKLHIYGLDSELNSIHQSATRTPVSEETISLSTVDEYCLEHGIERIQFLKIDVEGHDLAALCGAQKMLRDGRITLIQIEYGVNWIIARNYLKDLYDFIDDLPYAIHRIMPKGLLSIPRYSYALENFSHANYLLSHVEFEFPKQLEVQKHH